MEMFLLPLVGGAISFFVAAIVFGWKGVLGLAVVGLALLAAALYASFGPSGYRADDSFGRAMGETAIFIVTACAVFGGLIGAVGGMIVNKRIISQ